MHRLHNIVGMTKHIQVGLIEYIDTRPPSLHPSFGVLPSILFADIHTLSLAAFCFNRLFHVTDHSGHQIGPVRGNENVWSHCLQAASFTSKRIVTLHSDKPWWSITRIQHFADFSILESNSDLSIDRRKRYSRLKYMKHSVHCWRKVRSDNTNNLHHL